MIAFEDLKKAMVFMLVLALPNFENPFMVYTNAHDDIIKVILV